MMKKASSIGLMQKRGGGVYSPNIESSKQMLFGLPTKTSTTRGTTGNAEQREHSKNTSHHSINSKRNEDSDTIGGRKKGKLLTGNFFSPNIERAKTKPTTFSPNLMSRDTYNSHHPRVQKFGTEAYPASAKVLNLDLCENEQQQQQNSARHEVWSGTCNLKSFSSARGSNKVLSPTLMKSPTDMLNQGSGDNSYIKKVKQVLMERNGKGGSETVPIDEFKLSPKTKETTDFLNLKKLKQITSVTSGKNLFMTEMVLGQSNDHERLDKSNNIGKNSNRTPLMERDINQASNLLINKQTPARGLFSPQLMKQKQDADVSDSSILSKNKSTSVSKASVARGAAQLLSILQGRQQEAEEKKEDPEAMLELQIESLKSSKIKLLTQTTEISFNIYNLISQDKDPYESIRSYSDQAQNMQFNTLEVIYNLILEYF